VTARFRNAVRPIRRYHVIAGAVAALLAALALMPAMPARAEIVDYDPFAGPGPEILSPAELERLDAAMAAGVVYMISDLSPAGTYVQAFAGQAGAGFVDLATGELVPFAGWPPGKQVTESRWLSDTVLAQINLEQVEQQPPRATIEHYYWVTMDAVTGGLITRTFDIAPLDGAIQSAGPGMADLVVLKQTGGTLATRTVQIAPTFRAPRQGVPDDLPGLVQAVRLDHTIELQQGESTVALVKPDGSGRRELFDLPPDSAVAGITWSDDGRFVAITTRTMPDWASARPRREEPIWPGTPSLGNINVREALGLVPPAENPLVVGSRIQVFDVGTGAPIRAIEGADFPEGMLAGMAFSPSGSRGLLVIALRSDLGGRPFPTYAYPNSVAYRLLDQTFAVGGAVGVPGSDLLASGATFLDDDHLLFTVAAETDNHFVTLDLGTGRSTTVWDNPGGVLQFLARGERRVFSHSTVRDPWELWTPDEMPGQDAWGGRQVTAYNTAAVESGNGLAVEDVSWRAPDGQTIHGLYVHDAATPFPPPEPGPLVVWQAGGPGGQMTNDYGSVVESPYSILPHFGLPVLVANAVGRAVQTPGFFQAMADDDNFGQLDIDEIRSGVNALARRGIVHPDRVGVTGCSYGGYFTWQSLRAYPDLYAAGNPQCSLVDLTEEFTFGYTPFIAYLMGRAPTADPAEYLRDSPLYGVKDITSPVLIFHGVEDFLPVNLLTNAHDDLAMRGVEVRFLRVAGEGHGFGSPDSERYAAQEQIRFFRRHLVEAEVGPAWGRAIYLPTAARNDRR
jgi:dienelactone hydrolase